MIDDTFDPHPQCPTCTDTPRLPSRPVGSGALGDCLRCGERFVVLRRGSEPVMRYGAEELEERRRKALAF
jgi:hypothetical protein